MSVLHRSEATLGFYGDNLDPDEITSRLCIEPTIAMEKGRIWVTRAGARKVAHTGSWRLEAERCEPADLDKQIMALLDAIKADLPVWRQLSARFRGRLFCGIFLAEANEGLKLNARTLSMMGERGLILDLDIYERHLPE